jgi:hypothetical protein
MAESIYLETSNKLRIYAVSVLGNQRVIFFCGSVIAVEKYQKRYSRE